MPLIHTRKHTKHLRPGRALPSKAGVLYVCGLAFALLLTLMVTTPTASAQTTCDVYGPSLSVPTGYGASYNVFNTSEMMVSIACNEDQSITVTSGNNDPLTYIYNQGYRYDAGAGNWVNFTYSCSGLIADAWCVGQVSKTLTNVPTTDVNFLVSYTCQWSGSKWNCGCSNTSCSTNSWQLQGWEVPSGSGSLINVDPNAPETVFYHDFENEVPHVYTSQDLIDHWGQKWEVSPRDGEPTVVTDPSNSSYGNVLRIFYKGGEYAWGTIWITPLGAHEDLYFAYDIMFDDTFEWVKGGKLPGLGGGPENYSGGNLPDGTDGWMGRLMWRWGGRMSTYMNTYDFHRDPSGAKDIKWDDGIGDVVQAGKWHTFEMRYKMNTPGKDDGVHQVWLDGRLVADRSIHYRIVDTVKVDELVFSTFYGGDDSTWAPINDHYIYYDNFVVSTKPITH